MPERIITDANLTIRTPVCRLVLPFVGYRSFYHNPTKFIPHNVKNCYVALATRARAGFDAFRATGYIVRREKDIQWGFALCYELPHV